MQPLYAIYLLESEWTWDHTNTEIATLTVEGAEGERWQKEFECLVDPLCPEHIKRSVVENLKTVATAQNNCQMDSTPRLVRLYRVTDYDGILRINPQKGESPKLNLTLKLICEFDCENYPLIPKEAISTT